MSNIYSIGYAGLSQEAFLSLLKLHNIQCIADVRSSPYSKAFPHYNRENVPAWLKQSNVRYVYLGEELGPRSKDSTHYNDSGQVQFDLLSKSTLFENGIKRLENGAKMMNVAIMCAEKDPMTCHRSLLVAEYSKSTSLKFSHIHQDGSIESHREMIARAMKAFQMAPDMFTPLEEYERLAHEKLCKKFAFTKPEVRKDNNGGYNR